MLRWPIRMVIAVPLCIYEYVCEEGRGQDYLVYPIVYLYAPLHKPS